jgi:D-alanyl-D-alanine carboxypeptidase
MRDIDMSIRKSLSLIVGIALTCFSFNAAADSKPKPTPDKPSKPAPSAVEVVPSPPELGESAYLLMDYATGEVLIGKDIHKRIIPASLTKMMTSYVIG